MIIFDFEVFRFDTLLGAKIILDENNIETFQTWSTQEMREFYEKYQDDIWVGHNNIHYDNVILDSILSNKKVYDISKKLVHDAKFRFKTSKPKITYDGMRGIYSLKSTELVSGKNISETPIDFDIDRPLTEQEKLEVESYNRDDLDQTYDNFMLQIDDFSLRVDVIKEFALPLSFLNSSSTALAARVLGAHAIENIESMKVETKLPSTLRLKNQDVIDYYLNENFRKNKSVKIQLCGCEHVIASGGIHAALKKVHVERALYFDVSGYYNLIMILLDLLPRTMPKESKEKYTWMYYEQLKLKKTNPKKRAMYKVVLLCVFGAMLNKYTDFYDPWHGSLVTITGELYLVDLLEKLEGKVRVIQSNTDGIIVEPFDWSKKDEVIHIVEEWEQRTGFTIKKEEIKNLWQRDVNNYCFDDNENAVVRGEAVKHYNSYSNPIWTQAWNAKEPAIIAKGIVDYLLYQKLPEETVEKYKTQLCLFQYCCKKMSYDYMQYEMTDENNNTHIEKLQNINRAFASNDTQHVGTIIKYKKNIDGDVFSSRIQSLPKNVFVYNQDIRSKETIEKLILKIDYEYYVNRIYERIQEFIDVPIFKELA